MKPQYLIPLAAALLVTGCEKPSDAHLKFTGWCKLHGTTNLTFEEWDALRSEKLLPGQVNRDSESAALTWMAVSAGMSAASSGGSRR